MVIAIGTPVGFTANPALVSTNISSGTPVGFSASPARYYAGEVITVSVNPPNGTLASAVLTGKTPAPTLTGSGTTRTFVAPIFTSDTIMVFTVTDSAGAKTIAKFLITAAFDRVWLNGSVQRAYEVVWLP